MCTIPKLALTRLISGTVLSACDQCTKWADCWASYQNMLPKAAPRTRIQWTRHIDVMVDIATRPHRRPCDTQTLSSWNVVGYMYDHQ